MSDDLVERLLISAKWMRDHYPIGAIELIPAGTMEQAAARITELEAQNARLADFIQQTAELTDTECGQYGIVEMLRDHARALIKDAKP